MTARECADVLVIRRLHLASLLRELRSGAREVQEDTVEHVVDQLDAEAKVLRQHASVRKHWQIADGWLRERYRERLAVAQLIVAEAIGARVGAGVQEVSAEVVAG